MKISQRRSCTRESWKKNVVHEKNSVNLNLIVKVSAASIASNSIYPRSWGETFSITPLIFQLYTHDLLVCST